MMIYQSKFNRASLESRSIVSANKFKGRISPSYLLSGPEAVQIHVSKTCKPSGKLRVKGYMYNSLSESGAEEPRNVGRSSGNPPWTLEVRNNPIEEFTASWVRSVQLNDYQHWIETPAVTVYQVLDPILRGSDP